MRALVFLALLGCSGATVTMEPSRDGGASNQDASQKPAEDAAPPSDTGAPPPTDWSSAKCPPDSGNQGFGMGQQIASLPVFDCETGMPATIDDACGASAAWIFAAHTHCPACQNTASYTAQVARDVASKNVAVIHLVYDDNGTSCASWKAKYKLDGVPNLKVYADPNGQAWSKLKVQNVTAASAFLTKDRVITYKAHGLSSSVVKQRIDEALSQ